ncbi:MAG: hypothetical protein J6J36_04695 [Clostridia bacterium]|nr:hypothetical protein [Clostridia bacterium]
MIKQMAWNTFKNTGDINTFLELVQLESIEKNNIEKMSLDNNTKVNEYGEHKDKGDNIIRE